MATISRIIESAHQGESISIVDAAAVVVAILSLLTCTVLVPATLHLPW